MSGRTEFAVVDLETTGLYPSWHDRIIEVAILRVDDSGRILDEYATLVNPGRDLGPTDLHRIRAREIINAPPFEEVAGDVLHRMKNAVFVAHSVHFDLRFIQSEMSRIGVTLPMPPCLCTMQLARRTDPLIPSRRLGPLCQHFGVKVKRAHSAYHDARAAAMLLAACSAKLGDSVESLIRYPEDGSLGAASWPDIAPSGKQYRREHAAEDVAKTSSYLAALIERLPASGCECPEVEDYLGLLDRAMEDRRITPKEGEALLAFARDLGLSQDQVRKAHECFLRDLALTALDDGLISESERSDLEEVREVLYIAKADYLRILREANELKASSSATSISERPNLPNVKGMSVCFTGTLACLVNGEPVTRELAEELAEDRGMFVKKNVSKGLDLLVAADPDSLSGKARKARDYGVRVVAEPVFWRMLGIRFE